MKKFLRHFIMWLGIFCAVPTIALLFAYLVASYYIIMFPLFIISCSIIASLYSSGRL